MKFRKKLGKKILALGMTFAMCFTSVVGNISLRYAENSDEPDANLEESDFEQLGDDTVYTIKINDSENGRLYFYNSENNSKSEEYEKGFLAGDKVELISEASEGFVYFNTLITDKNGEYVSINQTEGEENIITFIMPNYNTDIKGVFNSKEVSIEVQDDGSFSFNGITTLQGATVTGSVGSEPAPYASTLRSIVESEYTLDGTKFKRANGVSSATYTHSNYYEWDYGAGTHEWCAGTSHYVIDRSCNDSLGEGCRPFATDSFYYKNKIETYTDGITYYHMNRTGFVDLIALQDFANDNGLTMTVQDSKDTSEITFNSGDIIYWINDNSTALPYDANGNIVTSNLTAYANTINALTNSSVHVNVVYEAGTNENGNYITILNNNGGSDAKVYLNRISSVDGAYGLTSDGIEISTQADGDANRIIVVHLAKSVLKPTGFKIQKDGDDITFPTATYSNGAKISDSTATLDSIADKYDGYGAITDARFTAKDSSGNNIAVYTDEDCTTEATNGSLEAGVTYYVSSEDVTDITVYETTAPQGWSKETEGKSATLSTDSTTIFTFTDEFFGDPLSLHLTKKGKASEKIEGAKFTVTCNETGEKWVYKTDNEGFINFGSTTYLHSGTVYLNDLNEIQFFLGSYTIKESQPASGYLAEGDYNIDGVEEGTFSGSDDVITTFDVIVDDADAGTSKTSINNVFVTNVKEFNIEETPEMMGFEVHKVYKNTSNNTVVGDMNDYTTTFKLQYVGKEGSGDDSKTLVDYSNGSFTNTVTYNKGDYIYAPTTNGKSDSLMWTTDNKGYYKSGDHLLQVGTYRIVEAVPPKGFIMWSGNDNFEVYFPGNSATSTEWQNVSDGYICLMAEDEGLANTEIRGGVGGFKYDYDSLLNEAANGSTFDGIEFWVRNDSLHDVYLDTDADGVGETLLKTGESYKFYTLGNNEGCYFTNPTFLSYGTYTIYEKQGTNTNYVVDETKGVQITIREDLDYYTLCKNQTDADVLKNIINTKYSTFINSLNNTYSDGVNGQAKREVNYKLLGTDYNSFFANKVARHGVAIIKYDIDDYNNASNSLNVVNGNYYPEPQGDAVLTGAKYQIINKNDGVIYIDTNNDHIGDTTVEKDGVCIEITTVIDKATGVEYACTSKTLLPCGTYEIVEVNPPKGYLVGSDSNLVKHSYTSVSDGQYFLYGSSDDAFTKLKEIVNNKYPITVYGNHTHTINWIENTTDIFANPIIRGQLTIEKHDADRKESNIDGTQGDADFENAIYEIYNISDHYVYTKGVNGGTVLNRYETGKQIFENLIGLDVDSIVFEDGINKTFLSDIINNNTASEIRTQMASNVCYTLTLDEYGKASTDVKALPYGTYLILEKTPSEGYLNSITRDGETAKIIRIREDNEIIDMSYDYNDLEKSLYEPVIRGGFEIYKYDEETRMNIPLGTSNLDASFEVINRSNNPVWVDSNEDGIYSDDEYYQSGEVVYTFITDKLTGKFVSSDKLLPYGTYEIHETYPPTGYLHLSNINPNMSVFFEIREEGKIVSEGWYYDKDGNKVTSTTHYDPLDVYLNDGTKIPNAEIIGERKEVTDNRLIIYNQAIRGDLFFIKKSAITMKTMAYIPFLMTSYDENGNIIEQHVIFTDQNGNFNTSSLYVDHTFETNSGDEMYDWLVKYEEAYENDDTETLNILNAEYEELVEKYKSGVGTWFGVNSEPNNDLGALPFGTYTIEELRCPNNNGYDMVTDTIVVDTNSGETDATTDPEGYKNHTMHGTINFGTIYNTSHGLSTVALTQDEQSHYSYAYSDLVIIDTVQYENVVPGRTYKLIAELHDQATGDILYDAFGEVIKVEKEFTPNLSTGSIAMNIDFDASEYKDGGAVVVYEYLYDITDSEDGILAMKEDNPFEEDQTIYFPKITSELIGEESKHHIEKAKDGIVLVDTIYYENLEPNKTYTIEGYLIDKAEIDYAKDDYDNHIIADIYDFTDTRLSYNGDNEIIFKPTESNGSFKLVYKFDGTNIKDKAYVSFIEISKNRSVIATHMDIEDELQTVYFPEIGTKAYDSKTTNNISLAEKNIKIIDTVEYSNVYPNVEYLIEGKLYNKDTDEFVCDENGNEIISTITFTPTSENGEVEVEFVFDGSLLEGTTLVVYETLYYSGYEIADHRDAEDEEQTIYIPKIRTKARDTINTTQIVNPDGSISITDTITYNNLIPSHEYVAKGYLMDTDTGEILIDKNGNEIVAENKFTVENTDGETSVTFTFDGYEELKGKTIVVFEELYIVTNDSDDSQIQEDGNEFDEVDDEFEDLEDEDFEELEDSTDNSTEDSTDKGETNLHLIAIHKDITDKDQTIYFPEIHTTAYDKDVCINITKADATTVIDTVSYYNLIEGIEYTVKGTLVDKATGEPILVNGEEITATQTFTAESIYGTIDVVFEFDATELAGKTLVAYEELYVGEFLISSHKDKDDEKQTIYIPKIGTQAIDNETNTSISFADDEATIIDTVSYENLTPGRQYLLVAQLMDKNTGEPIFLANGTEFDANNLEHSEQIEIVISDKIKDINNDDVNDTDTDESTEDNAESDASKEENSETTEITETTEDEEVDDGINPDLKDEDFEDLVIETEADEFGNDTLEGLDEPDVDFSEDTEDVTEENNTTQENTIEEDIESSTNTDTTIENEETSTDTDASENTVTDTDIATDDEIKNEVIIQKSNGGYYVLRYFTPTESNGTVDMTFIFDATGYEGNCTVAFEEVYANGYSIAEHKDINDEKQTITFPKIKTTATNKADGTHYAEAVGEITIVDTVEYSGLIIGEEYTVNGTLMIKETGNPLYEDMCTEGTEIPNEADRKPISATKTFIAESSEGSIDLEFTFDATLLHGKTVVVFEELYYKNIKVGTHTDITDKDQSVHLVKIGTVAIDKNTKTHTATYGKTTFVDTISYEGLIPGEEYIISGKLMDKATSKPLTVGENKTIFTTLIDNIMGNSNEFIGEIKFTPTESSGTIEIKFDIDTTNLNGKTIVVYEKLYNNGKLIAHHEDIEDKNQTIEVPNLPNPPSTPRTGVDSIVKIILSIMMILGGIGLILMRKKKKNSIIKTS